GQRRGQPAGNRPAAWERQCRGESVPLGPADGRARVGRDLRGRTMLDVRAIRANPEALREAIRRRKVDPARADLDRWLALDEQRHHLQARLDELNAEKNKLAQLGRQNPESARARGQEIRQASREIEDQLGPVTQEWQSILDWFPNWPHPDMPDGDGP